MTLRTQFRVGMRSGTEHKQNEEETAGWNQNAQTAHFWFHLSRQGGPMAYGPKK